MTFLLPLLLLAAPQAGDATCPATRFTLNNMAGPKAQEPKPEKKVAQAAPVAPKTKSTPKPGDCSAEKKAVKS